MLAEFVDEARFNGSIGSLILFEDSEHGGVQGGRMKHAVLSAAYPVY